ncbi:MAG: hypothetical protein QF486_05930 [Candidatus Woesearchaeota archaeon]|jgi:hypothetical protein|nr:hypothetical protein [Candidatus Woesearchaeota archaeon]MDP7199125.1 hypothetical protein [Candidatus Woesearchaeota archaeon]MDP7467613.1 hypothetical protein [Candidatus Woesearchaeota archaeon]MDP7647095.1 hypothetical protein [Candidatus Woesearchaeota archaeon]|tara:strand:+ start:358 stop:765 length:408 start_codon:yes stop_codon:yes gene_type:complete
MAKKEEVKPPEPANSQEVINSMGARIRLSEERMMEIRRKVTLVETNSLKHTKKSSGDFKLIMDEITEMKQTMRNIEDRIVTIIKELQLTPKKEDVDLVKKYMEYFNPVKFVTVDQIGKYVRDEMEDAQKPEEENI